MPRRVMEGRVVSDKTNKTVTVLVERRIMDPLYKKFIRRTKKYTAHDETNAFRTGDVVRIEECAPVSKTKRWVVVSDQPQGSRDKKPVEHALEARAAMLAAKPAVVRKPKPSVEQKPAKVPHVAAKTEAPKAHTAEVVVEKELKAARAKPAKPKAAEGKPAAKPAAKAKKKDES